MPEPMRRLAWRLRSADAVLPEATFLAAYAVLLWAGAGRPVLWAWFAAAAVLAAVRPVSGLVLFVAIAPFPEPFAIAPGIALSSKPLLVAAAAVGVLARAGSKDLRRRRSPGLAADGADRDVRVRYFSAPIAAALGLLLVTALGLLIT
jgi:ABC-type phosphate transport system auxiliary subunit